LLFIHVSSVFIRGWNDFLNEVLMLDIQTLRNDLAAVAARLATRGYTLTLPSWQLEAERKTIQTRTQELQAKRNAPPS
jgi:seryl-tRNA synthetase